MKQFLRRFLGRRYQRDETYDHAPCRECDEGAQRYQQEMRDRLNNIAGRVNALKLEADLIVARERRHHDRDSE